MQRDGEKEPEQLSRSWALLLAQLREDPRVSQLLRTRTGQYLLSHPALAQTLLLFAAFAVLPVALFLAFAMVTFVICAAGFVFFQGFLLFVGSLGLLSVLTGVAAFSVVVSLIFNVFYFIVSGIFGQPQLTKQPNVQGKERERPKVNEDQ